MVSKHNGSAKAAAIPPPPPPPAPPSSVPAAIAAAVEKAGGTVGPVVPAVQLTEFTLTISLERLNSIVACMGGGPFNLVRGHIDWIQKECQDQVAAAQKKANEAALAGKSE